MELHKEKLNVPWVYGRCGGPAPAAISGITAGDQRATDPAAVVAAFERMIDEQRQDARLRSILHAFVVLFATDKS